MVSMRARRSIEVAPGFEANANDGSVAISGHLSRGQGNIRRERSPRARTVAGLLIAALLAVAWAGCGSASHTSTPGLALSAYLVHGDEETGLQLTGSPATSKTPAQWTADISNGQAEESRLKAEGFHSAVSVQTGYAQGQGVSRVMELRSTRDAEQEQRAELESFVHVGGPVGRFAVRGVPTADGFTHPGPSPQDANAVFREGRCLLLVGDQESAADYRAPVIAAVRAIWTRTEAKNGACTRAHA